MNGTALVTGCSGGIGLRIAHTLAHSGLRVWAGVRRSGRVSELLTADRDLDLRVLRFDVTDHDAISSAVAAVGEVDVVVNNAGIGMFGAVESISVEDLNVVFATNFFGPLAVIRAVLPGMRRRGSGVIVNIGSVDAVLPGRPMTWSYAASKHALGVASEGLALEAEPFGVRVRQIDPGFFATNILDNRRRRDDVKSAAEAPYAAFRRAMESAVADGVAAAGDPQDVADAVLDAVRDPRTFPVRRLVGADAHQAVAENRGPDEESAAVAWKRAIGLVEEGR